MAPKGKPVVTEDGVGIQIEREPRVLPLPDPKELSALKRRMRENPHINLSDEAIDTAVGAFIDLPKVTRIATYEKGVDGLSSQFAGGTHLYILEGEMDAEAVSFPLGNPRLGHLLRGRREPRIVGALDENEQPLAQLVLDFDSLAEAEALIEETVRETLTDPGANYSDSILGHGVMTPVEAVIAEARFADGAAPLYGIALHDGSSRAASAALVRHHDATLTSSQNITAVALRLRGAFAVSSRRRRAAYLKEAAATNVSYGRDGLTMPVLRQLQGRRLPVRLIVGVEPGDGLGAEELPAAIAAAQSTRHISVNPWREAAKDNVTARRTVLHLRQADEVSDAFVALAEDRVLSDDDIDELFPDADPALVIGFNGKASPLWRAVVIVHTLTGKQVYEEAKRFIRSDQGVASVQPQRYAGLVGVLVDLPWRAAKQLTTEVARNAWRNGGPLSEAVFDDDWVQPVFAPIDELVRRADDGDRSARLTIQVLAGAALLADGILTRDRGSKIGEDGVTYRATPPVLLWTWSGTRHGRRQAVEVVRTFDPTRSGGSGTGRSVNVDYTYRFVDDSGAPARSGDTYRVLIEGDLFDQADPERASEEREKLRARQRSANLTREERNEVRRTQIMEYIGRAADIVKQLSEEAPDHPAKLTEHPFGTRVDWKLMRARLNDLNDALVYVMPPEPPVPLFEDDTDPDEA